MHLLSVNIGSLKTSPHTDAKDNLTGIDKRPVEGPVAVRAPGPKGSGGSGVGGDRIGDWRHHGGDDQAVYAYAREDLDAWARELGRDLPNGVFGENLTTTGLAVNDALIGERWRVGPDTVLEISCGRIPCRTFAGWLGERGWIKRFTSAAAPGAYLRVIEPGEIRAGDRVEVVYRPEHQVSVSFWFRAMTTEPALLPQLLTAADFLEEETLAKVRRRTA